jgi:23S rRNA (pseudouridine1915-N3)-methyltransferase
MPQWVREAYDDYARRLKPRLPVTLTELPSARRTAAGDDQRAVTDEGRRLVNAIRRDDYVVALDERGRQRSTMELSIWLGDRLREGRDTSLLIGGPDGFAPEVLQRAQESWSLSRMTLPHALVRVLLIEQLYRAVTILDGHPYHRE